MVTGASTANLAIILIDARNGLLEQTHRHSFIASLLGIPHVIICVNKMDLVYYNKEVYDKIVEDYKSFSSKLNVKDIRFIPISALNGDNVVDKSQNMLWYNGSTLLHELENIHISSDNNHVDSRFPVQYVIRPHKKGFEDYRGYTGKIESGVFKVGDKIKVLPSGFLSTITKIAIGDKDVKEAYTPMSISLTIKDDLDISRGDMIVKEKNLPKISHEIDAIITWLNEKPLSNNTKILLKHTTNESLAIVKEIIYEIDIKTLHKKDNISQLELNSIGRVKIRSSKALFTDDYFKNRNTGAFILIDYLSNITVGAGIIKY
jgi:sulfate adenylyltransferase subunit 1